ncbi:MAG: clan AA aspartic protease [Bacteroidales bacterium]|nr:clan AA aspartic protease [Bacteroidales bacterium]
MKTSKIDIEIARMDNDYNIHLIINANIKKRNLRLLIDTGATHSCIAKHIADNMVELETEDVDKLLNLSEEITDIEQKKMIRIPRLQVADFYINNYFYLITDLTHINMMYENMDIQPIDGLLGSDILLKYNAMIDYSRAMMIWQK